MVFYKREEEIFMVRKYCPQCKEYSYSACSDNEWICPSCGYDLTAEPVLNIYEKSERED